MPAPASAAIKQPLIEAVSLYQGDFLAGFSLPDTPAFDEWQFFERESLRQALANALETLIGVFRAEQAFVAAIPYARRWVALDPLHEPAHYQLIELYAQANQRTAALRQYQDCKHILEAELGIPPGPKITALYEQILAQPVEPKPPPAPAVEPLPPSSAPTNLPTFLTPFINRTQELLDINSRLSNPHCRLLTLLGPGGMGKTRLAIAAVQHQLGQFRDGVRYVDLTPLRSGQFLISTIVEALALPLQGQAEPRQQLLRYLQAREMLLLLDNFEALVEEAHLITEMLTAAPGLKLLVTSREALNVEGEWLYFLSGLQVPDETSPEALASYDSARLFIERARQIDPHFSLISEAKAIIQICRLLEGMPLGLELTAAWVRVLPCTEILHQLSHNLDFLTSTQRDAPGRHRSLRAVFEHSWSLLTPAEQAVLAQLSVFRGGFSREAGLQVTGASLFVLYGLINKSLLRRSGEDRYDLHELLRQFAAEKLQADPALEQAAQERHAEYYGLFLQAKEKVLDSDKEQEAIREIRGEIQNVRTGWSWAVTHQMISILDRYMYALLCFYMVVNWYQEGEEIFQLAVSTLSRQRETAQPTNPPLNLVLAKAMSRQAQFSRQLGRLELAAQLAQDSLQIFSAYQAYAEMSYAYDILGMIYYHQGQLAKARQLLRQSFDMVQKTADLPREAGLCLSLGEVAFALREYDDAIAWQRKSLAIYRGIKTPWGIAHALRWLGVSAQALGNYEQAEAYYQESLTLFEMDGNRSGVAACSNHLGLLAQIQAQDDQAKQWHQQSLALYQELAEQIGLARTLNYLADITCRQAEYQEARTYLRSALNITIDIKTPPLILQTLLGAATLLIKENNLLEAHFPPPGLNDLVNRNLIRAFELLTVVSYHQAGYQETRDQAQAQLTELVASLPPGYVSLLEARAERSKLAAHLTAMLTDQEQAPRLLEEVINGEEVDIISTIDL